MNRLSRRESMEAPGAASIVSGGGPAGPGGGGEAPAEHHLHPGGRLRPGRRRLLRVGPEFFGDFASRHRDKPFFFYYAPHLVHAPIVRTPDSRGGDLYTDNVAYLDKLVGKVVAALEVDRVGRAL